MENVVNKDIRWGFVGITVNEAYVDMLARKKYQDDEDYDFDRDLSVNDEFKVKELLSQFGSSLEVKINKGWNHHIIYLVEEMISSYADYFYVGNEVEVVVVEEDSKSDE